MVGSVPFLADCGSAPCRMGLPCLAADSIKACKPEATKSLLANQKSLSPGIYCGSYTRHLCHILLVRSKSQGQATFKGRAQSTRLAHAPYVPPQGSSRTQRLHLEPCPGLCVHHSHAGAQPAQGTTLHPRWMSKAQFRGVPVKDRNYHLQFQIPAELIAKVIAIGGFNYQTGPEKCLLLPLGSLLLPPGGCRPRGIPSWGTRLPETSRPPDKVPSPESGPSWTTAPNAEEHKQWALPPASAS